MRFDHVIAPLYEHAMVLFRMNQLVQTEEFLVALATDTT
jgi:hypothetical protein